MSPATVTIGELKQQVGPVPVSMAVHAQLGSVIQKTTRTGKPYYELRFADSGDVLILRVWSDHPMFQSCGQLQAGLFYKLSGEFGRGSDGKSIDSRAWKARLLDEHEAALLLTGSGELREKQEQDYRFIEDTVENIDDPRLKALSSRFLETYGERFRRTGAARKNHHARRGGLTEHVAQMMRCAIQVAESYAFLNRDLLVSGVLFHDVGKLWENAYSKNSFTMPYTEVSELIGHIPMGMEIVNKLWRDIIADGDLADSWKDLEPPGEKVRLHLLHLIASHHGEIAFGSPVVPRTPEAQVLHYIDNIDAKMEMFGHCYATSEKLGEKIYKKVWPLEGNLVEPLPKFEKTEETDCEEGESETSIENPEPAPTESIQIQPEDDGLPIPFPSEDADPEPL